MCREVRREVWKTVLGCEERCGKVCGGVRESAGRCVREVRGSVRRCVGV